MNQFFFEIFRQIPGIAPGFLSLSVFECFVKVMDLLSTLHVSYLTSALMFAFGLDCFVATVAALRLDIMLAMKLDDLTFFHSCH